MSGSSEVKRRNELTMDNDFYADFDFLIQRAENDYGRDENRWGDWWYRVALDYLDTFCDSDDFDEDLYFQMTYDLLQSFMLYHKNMQQEGRLFSHCINSVAMANDFSWFDYTFSDIVALAKYADKRLILLINQLVTLGQQGPDYDRLIDLAEILRGIGAIDEANELLEDMIESNNDAGVTTVLALWVSNNDWPASNKLKEQMTLGMEQYYL